MGIIYSTNTVLQVMKMCDFSLVKTITNGQPYNELITFKYGNHLGLFLIFSAVSPDGALINSSLSSPTAYNTSLKYLLTVSMDLLKFWWITLNL